MPVTITSSVSGATTTWTITVNVTIDHVKLPPRVRGWPALTKSPNAANAVVGGNALKSVLRYNDNPVPNTPLPNVQVYVPISTGDAFGMRANPLNNSATIVSTTGTYVSTVSFLTYSAGYVSGQSQPTNIYQVYVPDPAKMPVSCCIEVDLGAPFGTIRLVYDGGTVQASAITPPTGWARNQDRRNSSGCYSNDMYQVRSLGSRPICAFWMGVKGQDTTVWNRNGAFLDITTPSFTLNYPGIFGYLSLYGYNYQTSTWMRSNVTLKGRWRRVRHDDHGTYYPQPGAYLGASFNIPFTDNSVAPNDALQIVPTFGTTLTAPAMPTNEYAGLYLEITGTSDSVDPVGTPYTTTYTENTIVFQNLNGLVPTVSYSYLPPPYWPWDIPMKGYGPDDASVRWVRHAGYAPGTSVVPPVIAETTVAAVLTRVGKAIILRGGFDSYLGSGSRPDPTSLTPACTGLIYATDPTKTNWSQMVSSMQLRVSSMEWSAAWQSATTLIEVQEMTTPTSGIGTGVYRLAYSAQYFDGTTYQAGPGVLTTDVCALQNNVNGAGNNVTVNTNATPITVRGMSDGSATTPARGLVFLPPTIYNYYTVTIGDGTISKTFQFTNGVPIVGNIQVAIGGTNDVTTASLIAAINASGLTVTASVPVITDLKAEITLCRSVGQSGGWRQSSDRWTVAAP